MKSLEIARPLRSRRFVLGAVIACALAGCAPPPRSSVGQQRTAACELPLPPARCQPAAFDGSLFLRGPMTNWALDDDYAFQYVCNEYVLNVDLQGLQRFRITDPASSPQATFGAEAHWQGTLLPDVPMLLNRRSDGGASDLQFEFNGVHTIHVAFLSRDGESAPSAQIRITPKDFDDPADAPVTDPAALGVGFDSRDAADKSPFGAVVAGSDVHFALSAPRGVTRATLVVERRRLEGPQEVLEYREVARVALERAADGERERWSGQHRFDAIGVYGYYFELEIGGQRYLYQNNHDSVYWTREKGSGGRGAVEGTSDPLHRIRRFRQTVYRADYQVPEWARDTVFYYIFPERFRNGDPRNDPRPGPRTFHDKSVEVHKNWLDKPWLPHSGDGSDDFYGNDFFGGDLEGIRQKLDYLADLGVNALYLTPIFRAASNHKYDAADYSHVDPHFGRDEDFARLAGDARRHGIRVLLDASLNHTGSDSIYFDRYGNYPETGAFDSGRIHPESPYADWYRFDPAQADPDRQYRGWVGSQDLPEINKASPSFRQFAFGAPDSIMKRWLDRGAAGWRMDVAPWVPDDFWRDWRSAIRQHRPDALTIAETQFEASKFFLGDEFDSTMNYIFRNAVEDYANGKDARVVYRNIELMRELYPPQAFYALMNLLSTHDSPRALFDFGYHDDHDTAATIALAKQRLRLAAFFQLTFPGAPAIYYGDEVGVTGGGDPFDRGPYPWADLGGKPDRALHADYRRLLQLRRDHAVLRHGTIDAPAYIDEHVIVLVRNDGSHWAITATNNDAVAHTVSVPLPAGFAPTSLSDALSGRRVRVSAGRLSVAVPARFGTVLENR